MRLPRQIAGMALAQALSRLGYHISRQTGSHLRLRCMTPSEHHITIPCHNPLRIGTLSSILTEVAAFHGIDRDTLLRTLFQE